MIDYVLLKLATRASSDEVVQERIYVTVYSVLALLSEVVTVLVVAVVLDLINVYLLLLITFALVRTIMMFFGRRAEHFTVFKTCYVTTVTYFILYLIFMSMYDRHHIVVTLVYGIVTGIILTKKDEN